MNATIALALILLSALPSSAASAQRDVTDAEIQKIKATLDCKNGRVASYCKTLDLFAKEGKLPAPRTGTYAATVLYVRVNPDKPDEYYEGVHGLALAKGAGRFSRIIPENDAEHRQLDEFIALKHANKSVPATNVFMRQAKAMPVQMKDAAAAGKSLYFAEGDIGWGSSKVFVRQWDRFLLVVQFNQARKNVPVYTLGIAE